MDLRAAAAMLRRIGPHPLLLLRYSAHRLNFDRRQRRLRRTYRTRVARAPDGVRLHSPGPPLPIVEQLPAPLREASRSIVAEAESACAGRLALPGGREIEPGGEIRWNRDFEAGYEWPDAFYQDIEVTRLDDSSDAKVPWELSRGHRLLALARAAAVSENGRFLSEFEEQLTRWLDENPTGRGINWTNPMEVAIRAINWIWAFGALERAPNPMSGEVRRRATMALAAHGRHIAANLEGSPYLRSNHYLADILGLLVLGNSIEGDPAARGWARQAHRAFERQIVKQVLPDGINFEGSLSYHGLAMEMLVLARYVARYSGRPFSSRFDARLALMLTASRTLRMPDGRIPQFGDCDSGRILPADSSRPPSHDRLLWLGAAEFEAGRPVPGPVDPEVAWTFGLDAWRAVAKAAPERPPPECAQFDEGGVHVIGGGGTRVAVRCGGVGQNGNGGHAHNDLLSFELYRDRPLVVDSGTYVYTADPAARNEFRSTAAHSTIEIDGEEINPIDPRQLFRLRGVAAPTALPLEREGRVVRLRVSHDGYRRLPCRAVHTRAFELDTETGEMSVNDSITGAGSCSCASYVHLAPGLEVRSADADSLLVEAGDVRFALRFFGVARVETVDGWVSDRYGSRQRAPVVVATREGLLPMRMGYNFDFAPGE